MTADARPSTRIGWCDHVDAQALAVRLAGGTGAEPVGAGANPVAWLVEPTGLVAAQLVHERSTPGGPGVELRGVRAQGARHA